MQAATLSYSIGAVAFAALLGFLLARRRQRLGGGSLVLACLVTIAWCTIAALHAANLSLRPAAEWVFLTEALRAGVWLSLMLTLLNAGREATDRTPATARAVVTAVWVSAPVLVGVQVLVGVPLPEWLARTYHLSGLVIAATGALMVEQLYRNSDEEGRWAYKHLCLALGVAFAVDLYFYAEGLLLQRLSGELWSARGAVWAMTVPLLSISASRFPDGRSTLRISRRLAFYSTSMAAVGAYLLAMAAGGYYVRSIGGSWGAMAQVVFLVGAVLVLAVALFSGQARANVRVFLNKHFYAYKFDYREEWLRVIRLLFVPAADDTTPVPARALKAVAEIMDSPNAGLWVRDDPNSDYEPAGGDFAGRDSPAIPADSSLVRFLQEQEWIIDLGDVKASDERYSDLELPEWLIGEQRAWLVLPLLHGSSLLGIVVLANPRAAHSLTWEDIDLLKTVGRQVAGVLAEHASARRVAEASQFDAYNRLSAFIMHDLKNLIAQQSLVVGNAARHKDNPAFVEDAIQTVDNSVKRMGRLLEQLQSGRVSSTSARVNLGDLCRKVAADCSRGVLPVFVEVRDEGLFVEAAREQFALVLSHIVRNAQEASSDDSEVKISVHTDEAAARGVIQVTDMGTGMDDRFIRERLFKPFDTTKGNKGMGIGAYQAREFVRAAGGDVNVHSQPGQGTRFVISLPLLPVAEASVYHSEDEGIAAQAAASRTEAVG
ncbi:MAG: XrtA/PEP-CTERM system histidine kinase PrsK [Pseudomonadota bacterium]